MIDYVLVRALILIAAIALLFVIAYRLTQKAAPGRD